MFALAFVFRCLAAATEQREAKEKKEAEEKARKEVRVVVLQRLLPYVRQRALAAVLFGSPAPFPSLSQFSLLGFGLPEWCAGADMLAFSFSQKEEVEAKEVL